MKISALLLFTGLCAAFPGHAQDDHAQAPWMTPIYHLFEGMNKGDSALVHSAFLPGITLVSVGKDAQGNPLLRSTPVQVFLNAIGTPHPEAWSEPIWNISANHAPNLVQVWAEYAFYVGKKFSHCGVDTFQLVPDKNGQWKIFHLVDTRQKEGCVIPEFVSQKFK